MQNDKTQIGNLVISSMDNHLKKIIKNYFLCALNNFKINIP